MVVFKCVLAPPSVIPKISEGSRNVFFGFIPRQSVQMPKEYSISFLSEDSPGFGRGWKPCWFYCTCTDVRCRYTRSGSSEGIRRSWGRP